MKAQQEEVAIERARVAVKRDCFELTRDTIVFVFQLALAVIMLLAAVLAIALNPDLVPVMLLGGGGIRGVAAVLKRRARE